MTEIVTGLVLGLAGSAHCVAMCGPLMAMARHRMMASRSGSPSERTSAPIWTLNALYQGGRITTYGVLGVVAGSVGHVANVGGSGRWLSASAGILLIFMAFVPRAGSFTPGAHVITAIVGRLLRSASRRAATAPRLMAAGAGVLNALLPCGMVYAALTAAVATGHPVRAAGVMLSFGAGTTAVLVPALAAARFIPLPAVSLRAMWRPLAFGLVGVLLVGRGLLPLRQYDPSTVLPAAHIHGR